jgi:hypothetical protein
MQEIQDSKQAILDDLTQKKQRDAIIAELPKEKLLEYVNAGNLDMAVIKICVKMEAILHYDKHYNGDFFEMMDQYCHTFNTNDDESNDYDPQTPALLQKLRMCRNQIVHAEKQTISLSQDELKQCIDIAERM